MAPRGLGWPAAKFQFKILLLSIFLLIQPIVGLDLCRQKAKEKARWRCQRAFRVSKGQGSEDKVALVYLPDAQTRDEDVRTIQFDLRAEKAGALHIVEQIVKAGDVVG